MIQQFAGILFDLDGLIIDSEALGVRVWQTLCREQGFELTEEFYTSAVGRGVDRFVDDLAAAFGSGFDRNVLRRRRPEVWSEFLLKEPLARKPGFDELLTFLESRGIPRAIATSTERSLVVDRLRSAGLDETRFQAVVCGSEVASLKPAPDVYLLAAAKLGFHPEDCLAIEDSTTGVLAAHRAQVPVIMVPDLAEPSPETRALTLHVYADLFKVRDFLESLDARHHV